MPREFDPKRRMLSMGAALALLGLASISLGGCGGGGGTPVGPSTRNPAPAPTSGSGDIAGSVSDNHQDPHVVVITAAQLSAGAGLILRVANAFHAHTVELTGAQVMQIAGRERVSVQSSTNTHSSGNDPHNHMVTFN
jgi:hypothetical protein